MLPLHQFAIMLVALYLRRMGDSNPRYPVLLSNKFLVVSYIDCKAKAFDPMLIVDAEYLGFYKVKAKALVKDFNELFGGDIGIRTLNPSNVISRITN